MSELTFNEENYNNGQLLVRKDKTTKLTALVFKLSGGLIKSDGQARLAMIVFIVVSFIFIFFLNFSGNSDNEPAVIEAPPGQVVEYKDDQPPRLRPN